MVGVRPEVEKPYFIKGNCWGIPYAIWANWLHEGKSKTMMKDHRFKHYEDQSKAMMILVKKRL
jgi:hypothetical protein